MASVRLPKVFMGAQNHSLPDTKADAVLKHMIGTAGVKSVRYYQGQYVPDSTENIVVAPGINACVQDIQETKDRELQKLVVNLTGAGPHITARHLTDFVESCDRDFHLDMQNKLGNTTYVFEQVAVNSSAAYRGLPGMPKIRASKSRSAMPYVQFTKTPFTTNRTLDNVFFEQRQVLRQRLTFFQEHRVSLVPACACRSRLMCLCTNMPIDTDPVCEMGQQLFRSLDDAIAALRFFLDAKLTLDGDSIEGYMEELYAIWFECDKAWVTDQELSASEKHGRLAQR